MKLELHFAHLAPLRFVLVKGTVTNQICCTNQHQPTFTVNGNSCDIYCNLLIPEMIQQQTCHLFLTIQYGSSPNSQDFSEKKTQQVEVQ